MSRIGKIEVEDWSGYVAKIPRERVRIGRALLGVVTGKDSVAALSALTEVFVLIGQEMADLTYDDFCEAIKLTITTLKERK